MSGDSENGYVVGYFWSPDVFTAAYKNGFFRYFSVRKLNDFFVGLWLSSYDPNERKKKNKKQN